MTSFLPALEKALVDLQQPIVSNYALFLCAYKVEHANNHITILEYEQKLLPPSPKNKRLLLKELQDRHIIKKDKDFKSGIYRINEIADRSVDEICSIVDPFCYISHLSAMSRYGLTNRIPSSLILTTPSDSIWYELRDKLLENNYGPHIDKTTIFPLEKIIFPKKIRGINVLRQQTKFPIKTQPIKGSFARISEIGATFLDMLNNPAMCGGMEHILEVWKEHAPLYLEEIITAATNSPTKIAKVRAGYILDELLNIKDSRIDDWLSAAQRGSSQLLNPEQPFSSRFSEKWMISLNV